MSGRRRRVRRRVVDTDSDTPVNDARTDGGNRRPQGEWCSSQEVKTRHHSRSKTGFWMRHTRSGHSWTVQPSDVPAASKRDLGAGPLRPVFDLTVDDL